MRKSLFVILMALGTFSVSSGAGMLMGRGSSGTGGGKHVHGPDCQVLLGGKFRADEVSGAGADRVSGSMLGGNAGAVDSGEAVKLTPAESRLKVTIERVENLTDDAMLAGIFKSREVNHLLEDLKKLKIEKNPKAGQEPFEWMMDEWVKFIEITENQLRAFKALPADEQKRWRSKIELPLYFATGHFIVFLETRKREFDYSKMNSLLKAMNAESARLNSGTAGSEKLFMFLFEKQVFRFFSAREFRNCKA